MSNGKITYTMQPTGLGSLRVGLALGAIACERRLEELLATWIGDERSLAVGIKELEVRRRAIAAASQKDGANTSARVAAETVLQEVYEVLLNTEPGDDLDEDIVPQLKAVLEHAFGVRE
jgi:hypothetical protein